jgi:hypothetical protein
MTINISALGNRILASGLANELLGCSDKDLADIEEAFEVKLPAVYRALMKMLGRGAGDLWNNCSYQYPQVVDYLRDNAEQYLEANNQSFRLGPTDYVFMDHQGCEFFYFDTTKGDDPPVYKFGDRQVEPVKIDDTLSHFLKLEVDLEVKVSEGL